MALSHDTQPTDCASQEDQQCGEVRRTLLQGLADWLRHHFEMELHSPIGQAIARIAREAVTTILLALLLTI